MNSKDQKISKTVRNRKRAELEVATNLMHNPDFSI